MIKKIIRHVIQNLGYAKKVAFVSMSTTLAMKRIAARGIAINSVLDVGASNGSWSLEARQCWPGAHYHLVEQRTTQAGTGGSMSRYTRVQLCACRRKR